MSLTTNPNDPRLKNIEPSGMQEVYLVLSEEERAKGFVRPFRNVYKHVGIKPYDKLQDLTEEQKLRFQDLKEPYVKYEKYTKNNPFKKISPSTVGRYWTQKQLDSGCGSETRMGTALSETYARNPKFYGATFCSNCGAHFPVEEFIWTADDQIVGS